MEDSVLKSQVLKTDGLGLRFKIHILQAHQLTSLVLLPLGQTSPLANLCHILNQWVGRRKGRGRRRWGETMERGAKEGGKKKRKRKTKKMEREGRKRQKNGVGG